ncbi:hypothetical protein E2542_SST02021 [Spatholobus suberectus]|nr:hypothetical protein E2542_SST02021 [Spatholobus suberectus]
MSARARRRCQTKSPKGTASFGKPSIKGRHVSKPNIWTEHRKNITFILSLFLSVTLSPLRLVLFSPLIIIAHSRSVTRRRETPALFPDQSPPIRLRRLFPRKRLNSLALGAVLFRARRSRRFAVPGGNAPRNLESHGGFGSGIGGGGE